MPIPPNPNALKASRMLLSLAAWRAASEYQLDQTDSLVDLDTQLCRVLDAHHPAQQAMFLRSVANGVLQLRTHDEYAVEAQKRLDELEAEIRKRAPRALDDSPTAEQLVERLLTWNYAPHARPDDVVKRLRVAFGGMADRHLRLAVDEHRGRGVLGEDPTRPNVEGDMPDTDLAELPVADDAATKAQPRRTADEVLDILRELIEEESILAHDIDVADGIAPLEVALRDWLDAGMPGTDTHVAAALEQLLRRVGDGEVIDGAEGTIPPIVGDVDALLGRVRTHLDELVGLRTLVDDQVDGRREPGDGDRDAIKKAAEVLRATMRYLDRDTRGDIEALGDFGAELDELLLPNSVDIKWHKTWGAVGALAETLDRIRSGDNHWGQPADQATATGTHGTCRTRRRARSGPRGRRRRPRPRAPAGRAPRHVRRARPRTARTCRAPGGAP
jgi:hypothetical protein